ncbi:uncharacterized protein UTRI_00493_B [Ustilago trichophora]|uniref:Uncharacterized protein n=1 Tax=Ustilago trichophora TaxID=86804 RepID=A0A5C3DPK5_9BASI|nr:uncharacterized protein UTRI_00493_B [Ustilago trichophora]
MPTAASRSSDGPPLPDASLSAQTSSTASQPSPLSTAVAAASSAPTASSSSPLARQSPKARPRPLNHPHHPYRIELLDVTPVSVSLLWSTRPPPLSAIPLEVVNSQLRKRVKPRSSASTANRSSSPHRTSARATAVSPSPTSATAAAVSKSRIPAAAQASTPTNPSQPLETPISKLTEGLVATRSLNRKVTKIRLRAPPTVAAQPRRSSNSSAPSDSAHNSANDDDAWPSDDAATAVEDEAGSASDASDSGYEGAPDARHHVTSVFKDRVSVTVNGQDWSHVLLGERGSHEAIVVIFGLDPESDYDVQFLVKVGLDGTHDAFRASLRTRAERESSRSMDSSPAIRSASPSPLSRLPVSAPELDAVEPAPRRLAVLQAELEASEALKASLIADVKKARKESSKQEAGLRHEIDAVKRGMDRMSATDHRSRQKVLALQELIKQTTIHTKEIHEQAEITEKEQPEWEEQDAKLEADVEALRKEVEAEEAAAQAEWDKDEAALAVLEKELRSFEATAKALEAERDELRDDKLASVRAEIEKVKEQAKEAFNRPAGNGRRGGAAAGGSQRGGHRHASGPHAAANAAGNKAKAHQGGRGGKAGNFGGRAVSGPAGQFGGPGNNNSSGFAGASRGFMQSFGKGFRRGQTHNHQAQSFDAMAGTGYTSAGGAAPGAMLPPGQGYVPAGMQDQAMGMGSFGANGPYGPMDSFYGQPHPQSSQFPSGASEASQDDLYDPTLGFDPYDPSIDARRRSSLPLPQLSYNPPQPKLPASSTSTALNPANPEFVPSTGTGSNHASPVISKNPSASGGKVSAPTASAAVLPAHTAIATQSPPAGVASVEHSPTSSSRFAFPLARHLPTAGGSSSLATKSSSSALASATAGGSSNPNNMLNLPLGSDLSVPSASGMGANLFSMGSSGTASPFSRHSPLLPQGIDGSSSIVNPPSSMGFTSASPRFGAMGLHSHQANSTGEDLSSAPFAGSSKFGPLDYDPTMDSFGPAPNLPSGLSSAPGSNSTAAGLPPFSSSTISSIFGTNDTWSAGPSSTNSWITSSPPLGSGTTASAAGAGDIWSAPTLPGVSQLRTKMSLNDLNSASSSPIGSSASANNSSAPFAAFAGGRIGLGAIGQASVPNRSSPLASPVAASPVAKVDLAKPTDAEQERGEPDSQTPENKQD